MRKDVFSTNCKDNAKLWYILILLLAVLISCSKENGLVENPSINDPDFKAPIIVPSGDEQYLQLGSDYIFDQNTLNTYELILSRDNLALIDANPAAERYVEGMLIFQGDTISPVGIRYKGSIGGFVGCVSGSDWTNPTGFKTCTKLSMKVKINWEGREELFYKVRKLQFHSQNLDQSQMHERLGYWLFRKMGVAAPRSVHAKLIINGAYAGLFALTEQIDGRFAKQNYEDNDGNLYKEVWPIGMDGNPHHEQVYLNALRTNEDENPSVSIIRDFGQRIADASETSLADTISKYMDLNEIISFIAVDRTIRNDDGPFHWYCNINDCSNHNYFWYEEPVNKMLHLIPWDLDNAFENVIHDANPVTPIADKWGEVTNDCQPFNYGTFNIRQWSASCDKLTRGWASFEDLYQIKVSELKDGPLSASSIDLQLGKWQEQIREATLQAQESHTDAITLQEWEAGINRLKSQIEYARSQ